MFRAKMFASKGDHKGSMQVFYLFLKRVYARFNEKITTPQVIMLSFIGVIFVGSLLLILPISHSGKVEVRYLDALFTATSATCVTGLTTVTTATAWSTFGKFVILVLIQIGGLSLITIFFFFITRTKFKVSIKDRMAMQATVNTPGISGTLKTVLWVVKTTFVIEGVGAVLLFLYFFIHEKVELQRAIFYGVFHSVSAFCNAGFDILAENSLIEYQSSYYLNIVIMLLIISGGIGFSVWYNIFSKLRGYLSEITKFRVRFTLQSKIVLYGTALFLVCGAVLFFALEHGNPDTFGEMSLPQKVLHSFFQSTTLRTAGFASIDQGMLRESSKLVSIILMMIGASSGGTAGGIKITTIAIIFAAIASVVNGKEDIVIFKRTITSRLLRKALTVLIMMITLLLGVTVILTVTEQGSAFKFIDLFYEVASALGTVGNSCGVTPFLSNVGRIIIITCMFIGRLGPITVMVALSAAKERRSVIRYAKEEIMIG